jgi:hypothetical protein
MQTDQKYAGHFANSIGDHRALVELQIQGSADEFLRHLQQLLNEWYQLLRRQAAMSLVHRFGQCVGNPRTNPHNGGLLDAEPHRDGIGRLEANTADIPRQAIRVLGHDLDGVSPIGLEYPHRPRRADAVTVQEDHDFANRLLFGPGGENTGSSNRPDAFNLARPLRRRFDDVEHFATPRIIGDERYFSMPSTEVGADARRNRALNCCPWVRSLTHSPFAVIRSPAEIVAAWPITVTRSRCPRAFARRTQKPFSALWNLRRPTRPASTSWVDDSGCGFMRTVALR